MLLVLHHPHPQLPSPFGFWNEVPHLPSQPLSYSVDLRRLLARASDTKWSLGPAQSWLAAGPAGGRVLCVSAGAGEGKSTISAVMCSGLDTAGAEPPAVDAGVAAFHFFKYR